MKHPNVILITGASSGIGEALAHHYAAPDKQLYLTGRNEERLQKVATGCEKLGASVTISLCPVEDRAGMKKTIDTWDAATPIDLVIANAGVDGSAYDGDDTYYGVMDINVGGVLNTVLPALAHMRQRRKGQIAIISSLAGLRGLPSAVAYSTSKNAVRALAEGLRGRHRGDGIEVSVVCPGFVDSRITQNNKFPMPMKMPAAKAARYIAGKLERNKGRIAFPWPMYFVVWLMTVMPTAWADTILSKSPRKQ